ncbi:MAG TPA: hypothetical protein VH088_08095 [Terriglobales bacterium]|nr:hypothetical protein [Terriglobales bacterium]
MKRITSILTGLSLAVLFFVGSAHAQYDAQRMRADIPFEFTVGNVTLPAGQYDFLRSGANIFQVRNAEGHSVYTMATAAIGQNAIGSTSELKFTVVQGHHVLTQIWNQNALMGNDFRINESYLELAKQPAVHAISAGRR